MEPGALPAARRLIVVQRTLILLGGLPGCLVLVTRGPVGVGAGLAVGLVVVLCAGYVPTLLARRRAAEAIRGLANQNLGLGPSRIALTDTGMKYEGESWSEFIGWVDLHGVESDGEAIYLFKTESHAILVPADAFPSESSRKSFLNRTRTAIDASRRQEARLRQIRCWSACGENTLGRQPTSPRAAGLPASRA